MKSTDLLLLLVFSAACTTPPPKLPATAQHVVPASSDRSAYVTNATAQRSAPAAMVSSSQAAPGATRPIQATAELGRPAPDFTLKDTAGRDVRLSSFRDKIVVLEWFSTTCPYSVFAHDQGPLRTLPDDVSRKGGVWLSISSKGPGERGGTPQEQEEFARRYGLRASLLVDADQDVARAYDVKKTPQVFIVNAAGVLVYRGALDNAPLGRVKDGETQLNYVEAALADLRSGRSVTRNDTEPYGCAVKLSKPMR